MTCPHGHAPPHCTVTGCEASRPAQRLADWTIADAHGPARGKVDASKHDRAAVTLHHDIETLAARDTASGDMTHGKGFIGVREDGRVNPGARPWWWCYGNQPIAVRGAVYAETEGTATVARGVNEAHAQREAMKAQLEHVAATFGHSTPEEIAAELGVSSSKLRRMRRGCR